MKNRNSYDAWGRPRSPSTWVLLPFGITSALVNNLSGTQPRFDRGYTGHEQMAGFGLINTNGRLYDPYLQRFLSPDRYVQDPCNAQNYNRYTYCLNNPLMYTDPSGWQSYAMDYYIMPGYSSFMAGASAGRKGNGSGSFEMFGAAGSGGNGTGLDGTYYDWSTHQYRSKYDGSKVSWGYAYNIAAARGRTYSGAVAQDIIREINNPRTIGVSIDNNSILHIYQNKPIPPSWTAAIGVGWGVPNSDGSPTIDMGGFVDGDKFYDYMLNQAKNNPVEVAALKLNKNGKTSYFVLPWNKNDRTTSRFTTRLSFYGLDGYGEENIEQFYHTHPGSSSRPGPTDIRWSRNSLVPIWAICPDGNSYIYSPLEGTTTSIDLNYFLNL